MKKIETNEIKKYLDLGISVYGKNRDDKTIDKIIDIDTIGDDTTIFIEPKEGYITVTKDDIKRKIYPKHLLGKCMMEPNGYDFFID